MTGKSYYCPTQVKFLDDEEDIQYGIAFEDKIICACCGGIYELDEVEILTELDWADFRDTIKE